MTVSNTVATRLSGPMLGHLAMLTFSALVAGSFSLGSMVAGYVPPSVLMVVRFFFAALLVGAIGPMMGQSNRVVLKAPWRFFILGSLFSVYFVLMYLGLETADAVSISAVFTLTPFISAIFAWFLMRQVTTPRMALALSIGCLGAIWVIFGADVNAILAFRIGQGEAVFFWGMIAHALYTPMARKLNRGEHPVPMAFGTLAAGFLVLLVYSWTDLIKTDWASLPPIVWIFLAYVSVVSGAISLCLIQFATLRLPSAKVMAYTYLVPSWVILWELALGRSAPPPLIFVGVLLTIVALLMLLREA